MLLRGVGPRLALWKPSIRQRGVSTPAVARSSSRRVWTTVSRWSAQIESSTSPWQRSGSSPSLAKAGIAVSPGGRAAARP